MGHFRDVSKAVSAALATSCNLTLSSGFAPAAPDWMWACVPVWGVLIMLRAVSIRAASASALLEGIVYFYLNAWESCGEHHTLAVGVLRALALSSEAISASRLLELSCFAEGPSFQKTFQTHFLKKKKEKQDCTSLLACSFYFDKGLL